MRTTRVSAVTPSHGPSDGESSTDGTEPDRFEGRLSDAVLAAGLRRHLARGVTINAAFQVGLAGLSLVQRLVVAAFLTTTDLGTWGLLLSTLLFVLFIKNAGIADKFVQQAEPDQERAFQNAFAIDILLGAFTVALAAVAIPIAALAYGHTEIIVPGLAASLVILGSSLQSPAWIWYRQMDFVRQRSLQAIDPCVTFVVSIALAVAGAGYWSLVIGALSGAFTGGLAALAACPYRLRLRLDRGTVRDYFTFSWPLVIASGSGVAALQATMLIAIRTQGIGQAGAIVLAGSIVTFATGVDGIVTGTLYPAICAARGHMEVLVEAFTKSNRLALMWGLPFGLGVALFASDLIHFLLGSRWQSAIVLLQALGVVVGIDQLGFNWTAFMRAMDKTRPLAALAALDVAAFAVISVPLLITRGLPGLAVGWLMEEAVRLLARTYLLRRLFVGFGLLRHGLRAIRPALSAVMLVLLARLLERGPPTALTAGAEFVLFAVTTVAATFACERTLLREFVGYLRRSQSPTPVRS